MSESNYMASCNEVSACGEWCSKETLENNEQSKALHILGLKKNKSIKHEVMAIGERSTFPVVQAQGANRGNFSICRV